MEVTRFEPASIQYERLHERLAIHSEAKTRTLYPVNDGTFSPIAASVIRFNLTGDVVDFRESYITFTLNIADSAASLDYSSLAVINRWRLLGPGGVIIDDISGFGPYATAMIQARASTEFLRGPASFFGCPTRPFAGSEKDQVADGSSVTLAMPIQFGLLGSAVPLPLFLTPSGLTLELTLESSAVALVSATAAAYTITSCKMNVHDIRVESDTRATILSKLGESGGFELPYEGVQHIPDSGPYTAGTKICRLDSSIQSCKSVYGLIRDELYLGGTAATAPSISCRCGVGFSKCWFTNAASVFPEGRISSTVEAYMELKKSLGQSIADGSATGQITRANYESVTADHTTDVSSLGDGALTSTSTLDTLTLTEGTPNTILASAIGTTIAVAGTETTCLMNTFMVGIDTESFESDGERLKSGITIENATMTYEMSGATAGATHTRRYDHYLVHDRAAIITPDGMIHPAS